MRKKIWSLVMVAGLSLALGALPAFAQDQQQPTTTEEPAQGMMGQGQGYGMMQGMPSSGSGYGYGMMGRGGYGMTRGRGYGNGYGMMGGMGEHMFYLNMAGQLGLTPAQMQQLRGIRIACLKANVALQSQMRVHQLEMTDLLSGAWKVADAEKLVRQMGELRTQMMLNHLKYLKEAQGVLTPAQRQRVQAFDSEMDE
jgi:Spy/CpxP family protein refolding chaperone